MDDASWAKFVSEMELCFAGDLGGELTEEAYRAHLGALDYDVARAALTLLVADGQAFVPRPGEVMSAALRVAGPRAVRFSEAWQVIVAALRRNYDDDEAVLREVADALGEGPARFCQRHGVGRLRREPTEDPQIGGAVIARLGSEFEDVCESVREDGKVGLALEMASREALAAGRAGLRRIGAGPALRGLLEAPGGAA